MPPVSSADEASGLSTPSASMTRAPARPDWPTPMAVERVAVGRDQDGVAGDGGGDQQRQHRKAGDHLDVEPRRDCRAAPRGRESARRARRARCSRPRRRCATAPMRKKTTSPAKPPTASASRSPGHRPSSTRTSRAVTPERDGLGDPKDACRRRRRRGRTGRAASGRRAAAPSRATRKAAEGQRRSTPPSQDGRFLHVARAVLGCRECARKGRPPAASLDK